MQRVNCILLFYILDPESVNKTIILLPHYKLSAFPFLVVFSFFEKTTYCCRTRRLSVRLSSVRPSVEIISFRGNSLPTRPIELKIGLNVREGVVHVRKAWFFEILIASCKFMQFAIFCK